MRSDWTGGFCCSVQPFRCLRACWRGLLRIQSSQWRLAENSLKAGGAGGGRHRAQRLLVTVEVALALVLLIGAGLMIRIERALECADPGFRPDNVLTFGLSFPPSMRAESAEARRASLRDLSDRLNSMPGVTASFLLGALPCRAKAPYPSGSMVSLNPRANRNESSGGLFGRAGLSESHGHHASARPLFHSPG